MKRLSAVIIGLLLVVFAASTAAQDPTPPAAEPPTLSPTETPLQTETLTLTETLAPPTNTETLAPPTNTETLAPPIDTETPAPQSTSTDTLTPVPSETFFTTPIFFLSETPFATPTLTPTPVLPGTEWILVFNDSFAVPDLVAWNFTGSGWGYAPQPDGSSRLLVFNSSAPVFYQGILAADIAVEVTVDVSAGTAHLYARHSGSFGYEVRLTPTGEVVLLRAGAVMTAVTLSNFIPNAPHRLRLSVAGNTLWVEVDGLTALVADDSVPLPPGQVGLSASFAPLSELVTPVPPQNQVSFAAFSVYQPADQVTPTASPTAAAPTSAPTMTLFALPELPLTTVYTESFDGEAPLFLTLGPNWRVIETEGQRFLQVENSNSAAAVYYTNLTDLVLEAHVNTVGGTLMIIMRESAAGGYRVTIDPLGSLRLYRADVLLGTVQLTPPSGDVWRSVRVSMLDNIVQVSIDGVPQLVYSDPTPFPAGAAAFYGEGVLQLDDVQVLVPSDDPLADPALWATETPQPLSVSAALMAVSPPVLYVGAPQGGIDVRSTTQMSGWWPHSYPLTVEYEDPVVGMLFDVAYSLDNPNSPFPWREIRGGALVGTGMLGRSNLQAGGAGQVCFMATGNLGAGWQWGEQNCALFFPESVLDSRQGGFPPAGSRGQVYTQAFELWTARFSGARYIVGPTRLVYYGTPPPELTLTLDVDPALAPSIPRTDDGAYIFTVGDQIPLLAEVSVDGTTDITDPVRVELTVPRGLRPQGMAIQNEDPIRLSDIFSTLICVVTGGSNCGDLLNEIVEILVTSDTVTYVYDIEGGVVVGQPFPITLDVVGDEVGTFEVRASVVTEPIPPNPSGNTPEPKTSAIMLAVQAPNPAACPVYAAYQANQPIDIQLLNQIFSGTDSALKHACLYMYRDLIYYIIFHEMSALHVNPYVSEEDSYSLSVLDNRTYAPIWGNQAAIPELELTPFDPMPRFDSFYYMFGRVAINGLVTRIVEQRAEPLVGYFGSNFNSAMASGDCGNRTKVELDSVGGRTFQPVCAYLPFWNSYAASIRVQGISDGTWVGEFAMYGLPEVDRAIYHAAYNISDPTDSADGVRPVNRYWQAGEPSSSSPFVFRTYIDLMTTYTWGERDYIDRGNTYVEAYVISPDLSLNGSTQVAAALGETCSNVDETLAQSYMRNLRLIYGDATYQSIPAYPDASRAYLTRDDVRYGMSREYSRSANALVVESQFTRDASGRLIPLQFSLGTESPIGNIGSLSWQTYRFTRPFRATDTNFPTDRPILQFLNGLEPVPTVSDASGQPQRVEFILCP